MLSQSPSKLTVAQKFRISSLSNENDSEETILVGML
jgi:hypothetical protein